MSARGFASDNNAGVHPDVLAAVAAANVGHVIGYGDDQYTASAEAAFRRVFGDDSSVFFAFNGTAANVLALGAMMRSHEAVICAETSHLYVDECGAPERILGSKVLTVETQDGKLTPEFVDRRAHGFGDEHRVQPKVVSIAQPTELGTVYTPAEVRALADQAHARGMLLHVDGARIANAAASLGLGLREATNDLGADALSFGGTKNGLLGGEAVVFFDSRFTDGFRFLRKQTMQLASKMRFLAVQFEALLSDDLWRRNAAQANAMATRLAKAVEGIRGIEITQPVDANGVFALVPADVIPLLQERFAFYVWDERRHEVRWMTSWDTTESDVDAFAASIDEVSSARTPQRV